jgi:hypothetical protein
MPPPERSLRKATRVPSAEIAGSLSSASSVVKRIGSRPPICCVQMSRLPASLRSLAKASRLPSRESAG